MHDYVKVKDVKEGDTLIATASQECLEKDEEYTVGSVEGKLNIVCHMGVHDLTGDRSDFDDDEEDPEAVYVGFLKK